MNGEAELDGNGINGMGTEWVASSAAPVACVHFEEQSP